MHDDGPVNLHAIAHQYQGKCLADLVAVHIKTMRKEILPQVLRGTFIEFDAELHPLLEEYTDKYVATLLTPDIASSDLSELFNTAINDIRDMCRESAINLEDNRIFDVFHIVILKLAQRSYTDPEVRKILEITTGNA